MTIQQFGLTQAQLLKRRGGIGGSDANIIMGGDPAAIIRLWEEKTGQAEPEDLSNVLPVQIGNATEDFNRYWYTKQTGKAVTRGGEHVISSRIPYMMCTLDGIVEEDSAYFDAKHVNQYSKLDTVVQRYMPQMHHNAYVLEVPNAVLSVIIGTLNYEHVKIEICPFFTATLIEAEAKFWECVTTMTPPGEIAQAVSPALPAQFRTVDMTGNNHWAVNAETWRAHKGFADLFKKADAEIKSAVEFDVGEASGHGICVKRSKAGALTIREMKHA